MSEKTPWVFSPIRTGAGRRSAIARVKVSPALTVEPAVSRGPVR